MHPHFKKQKNTINDYVGTLEMVHFNTTTSDNAQTSVQKQKELWCWKAFTDSTCFNYTKIVIVVIYALNFVACGEMVFLVLLCAANINIIDSYK